MIISRIPSDKYMLPHADPDAVQLCLRPLVCGGLWGHLVTEFSCKSCPQCFGLLPSCFACFEGVIWENSKTVFPRAIFPES